FWIRERRLGLQREADPHDERVRISYRRLAMAGGVVALVALISFVVWRTRPSGGEPTAQSAGTVVQTIRAGDLDIALLSPSGTLRQGRNRFTIEFRRTGATTLVDVGTVRASANMPMPGMVMSGGLQVTPTDVPGRYAATAEFGMAGAWQMAIDWNGPAGQGSVSFQGGVQ
ncbi:MAG TPA: FixH family protein, partial [Vicinamibacterales bacterium]|nr:FixH family protein [Vicinamibacterales bacterium]